MSSSRAQGAAATRPRVVLTIGKLDGVHAGHRHLAAHVQARADELGARSAAIVLHPDPVSVLSSKRVPRLTTVDERCSRLRAFGIEVVEPLRFTREIATLAPEVFVDRLEERFEIAGVVVGPDFAFGRQRLGDVSRLDALATDRGFAVDIVSPIEAVGEWISSRRLRGLVDGGDIALARTLMRLPPRVVGKVIHGAARGRELGFPTANLDLTADFVLPANGIYTVTAEWREHRRAPRSSAEGVASVGVRPTFDNGARLVEVHLFDFDGDLYDKELTVDFLVRQRPEERFDSVTELVTQMELDSEVARRHHDAETRPRWRLVSEDGSCETGPSEAGSSEAGPSEAGPSGDGSFDTGLFETGPSEAGPSADNAAGDTVLVRVRGRDLADLCQSAADAIAGASALPGSRDSDGVPGVGPGCGDSSGIVEGGRAERPRQAARLVVTLSGKDDTALFEAWLAQLSTPSAITVDGRPASASGASVYQAGAGLLHALLRPSATSGGTAPARSVSLVRWAPAEAGWLEADLEVPVTAPRPSQPYS